MFISKDQMDEMHSLAQDIKLTPEQENEAREAQRQLAIRTLYNNQECYVAQWILQNPFVNPEHYALKFTYNDKELSGYSVTMEKIQNV